MAERIKKEDAHELVDRMPENATWDDLINEIYVRQVIEQGLADSKAGRTTDVGEVRKRYGLESCGIMSGESRVWPARRGIGV
jgi:hypothetical protein